MPVSNAFWFLLVGGLLLLVGMAAPYVRRLPVTSSIIYLCVGIIVGPTGLFLFHFNPLKQSALLELLTEIAVLISLFAAGLKMPVPFRFSQWHVPIRLAFLSMACSVGLVAMFAFYALGLPIGAAILLGAIVAPTDPVLATDVQVRHPGDNDAVRFSLTSEAGLNDGSAFPFVMLGLGLLGLHELGSYGVRWVLIDVIWSTFAGIAVGIAAGYVLAVTAVRMRSHSELESGLLNDFLGLGLIATVYGTCLMIDVWGFLAVFAAAVTLRQTELQLAHSAHTSVVPFEVGVTRELRRATNFISDASLVFKEHLERISEVVLVLLIGGTLFVDSWSWHAVGFAAFLFLIARPLSVMLGTLFSGANTETRVLAGWFGVRGIGSLYYLMYAIQHGLSEAVALELIQIVLVVVTLSIIVHGVSVKPVLWRLARNQRANVCAADPLPIMAISE